MTSPDKQNPFVFVIYPPAEATTLPTADFLARGKFLRLYRPKTIPQPLAYYYSIILPFQLTQTTTRHETTVSLFFMPQEYTYTLLVNPDFKLAKKRNKV